MKAQTNNPNGRPQLSDDKKRKMISLRLKPRTVEWLKRTAAEQGISQSAVIDSLAE